MPMILRNTRTILFGDGNSAVTFPHNLQTEKRHGDERYHHRPIEEHQVDPQELDQT